MQVKTKRQTIMAATCGLGLMAGLCGFTSLAVADDLVQEQATSEVKVSRDGNAYHVQTVNRTYEYHSFAASTVEKTTMADMLHQLVMIEKTSTVTEADNDDPQYEPSTIKVTVFPLTPKGKGPALFTITGIGEAAKIEGSDLVISRPGCCVEYETKADYSLENGKYLYNTTTDHPATMGATGGFAMSRIAVAHVAPTGSDDVIFGKTEHAGAVISWASPTAPLQRVMVLLPKDAADDLTLNWDSSLDWVSRAYPKGINHIYVERADKPENVFTDATLRFKLDEGRMIQIPLVHDRLDLSKAKMPKGYSLKEMPL